MTASKDTPDLAERVRRLEEEQEERIGRAARLLDLALRVLRPVTGDQSLPTKVGGSE